MDTLSFTLKKNTPTQQELNGDYEIGTTLHNRLYVNCKIEINSKVVFITNDKNEMEAIFSIDQYSIMKYE
ncbi:MAG: hypothetical protein ABI402_15940 [Ferruginibacter sp.]